MSNDLQTDQDCSNAYATPSEQITVPIVKGADASLASSQQGNFRRHNSRAIYRSETVTADLPQTPLRVDPTSQTIVSAADERNTVFDGSKQSRHGMLPGSSGLAEPAIIGHVDQEICIRLGRIPAKLWESIFETN